MNMFIFRALTLMIDGVSVYQARINMGRKLADRILREMPNHDIDVVIPIPDTSRTSALEVAQKLEFCSERVYQKPLHRPNLYHAWTD